jgi:hypothetical protein
MMGKQNEPRLSALPTSDSGSDLGRHDGGPGRQRNATQGRKRGAGRLRSPQQEKYQATANHKNDGHANEQDRRHVKPPGSTAMELRGR